MAIDNQEITSGGKEEQCSEIMLHEDDLSSVAYELEKKEGGTGIPDEIKKELDTCHTWLTLKEVSIDNKLWKEILTYLEDNNKIEKIVHLDLSGNQLTSLHGIEKFTKLRELDLSGNQLTSLHGIGHHTKLNSLNLHSNKLSSLEGIEGLIGLTTLYLSSNQLTALQGIENLTQLDTLYLSGNKLTSLQGIEYLTQLSILILSKNQLTSLQGIENLTQLKTLSFYSNKLSSLQDIKNLTQLNMLDVSFNQLTSLQGIENLTQLEYIFLSGNQLTSLQGIENLTQLGTIQLDKPIFTNKDNFNLNLNLNLNFNSNIISYSDISYTGIIKNKPATITNEQYNNRAINDPLSFILLLEDSRKAYDTKRMGNRRVPNTDTQAYRDSNNKESKDAGIKDTVPTREILINKLTSTSLLTLLDGGSQEILSGYESTFAFILNEYYQKDKLFDSLDTISGEQLRTITSTIAQLAPRYEHLGQKGGYNQDALVSFFDKVNNKFDTLLDNDSYTIDTMIQYMLPIIGIYGSDGTSNGLKKILQNFLIAFSKNASQYYICEVDNITINDENPGFFERLRKKIRGKKSKDGRTGAKLLKSINEVKRYELSGLLLYQLGKIDKKIAIDKNEKNVEFSDANSEEYELESTHLQSFTFNRSVSNPGITHMFFDNNEDGKGSFDHRLTTIGINTTNQTSNTRGGITYTLKKITPTDENDTQGESNDASFYEVTASVNNKVLHKIYANHPTRPQGAALFPGSADIVVDRGHAGGEKEGLQAIGKNTKLVLIGSCGGYSKLGTALNANPHIQYIGTTATGNKSVNDPIFRSVIEAGCKQQTINWNGRTPKKEYIQEKDEYESNRSSYQLPHKQRGSALKAKYNKLLEKYNTKDDHNSESDG